MDPKSANKPKKETDPGDPRRDLDDEEIPSPDDEKTPRRPSRASPRESDS